MGISESLIDHLRIILRALQEIGVDHALAGGLAFSALVEPRATVDIDMIIMLKEEETKSFFPLLEKYFDTLIVHSEPLRFQAVTIWRAVSVQNSREIILDFMLAETPFHRNAIERAMELDFFGLRLKVVTPEDLIILKKCAHRPQDMLDIATIYKYFGDDIDDDYIERCMKELDIDEI